MRREGKKRGSMLIILTLDLFGCGESRNLRKTNRRQ